MSYQPQYLSNLVPPILTKAPSLSAWQRVRGNHGQLFRYYEPTVAQWAGIAFESSSGLDETLFRFRSRNGADFAVGGVGLQLRVTILARRVGSSGLPSVLSVSGGAAVAQVNVTSPTFAVHTLTATPASDDEEWTISGLAGAGDTLEVCSMVAFWFATAPGTRAYPSGFRQAETAWNKDDIAVSTEFAARLLDGPVCIAKDRPACVFSHLWRADTDDSSFVKSGNLDQDVIAWGVADSTMRMLVGRGRIPRADITSRPFIVTYYLRSSTAATGSIAIGAATYAVTANAWQSFQVQAGAVDVDIIATVDAVGAGQWAYFESVQVWRQAE